MKSESGISVVALVITIIVIIMITGITAYTGVNMINKSRVANSENILEVVYNAIIKDESAVDMQWDTVTSRALTASDYYAMGLDEMAKNINMEPLIYVAKSTSAIPDASGNMQHTYTLVTQTKVAGGTTVSKTYTYYTNNTQNYIASNFNYVKGINVPCVFSGMQPITYENREGNTADIVYLDDAYDTNWYDYSGSIQKWANAIYNGKTYVWIPRYAYKIQNYYIGTDITSAPNTAIDVMFLQGVTNTTANGEILPSDYIVHPAFTFGTDQIAGLWVEKNAILLTDEDSYNGDLMQNIGDAFEKSLTYITTSTDVHMMKNVERGAVEYLMFAKNAYNSSELSSVYLPNFLYENEYVSAFLNGESSNLNINGIQLKTSYEINQEKYVDVYTTDGTKVGDAVEETSTGDFQAIHKPNLTNPFIIRNNLFGYNNAGGADRTARYRRVLIAK